MNSTQAAAVTLVLAIAFANLPFARLVAPRRWPAPLLDLTGWLICYGVWMGAAQMLESAMGKAAAMGWEVWAVSLALFAVLAFPGIVWRYLLGKAKYL
jgi:hypothetical protein